VIVDGDASELPAGATDVVLAIAGDTVTRAHDATGPARSAAALDAVTAIRWINALRPSMVNPAFSWPSARASFLRVLKRRHASLPERSG